MLDYTKKPDPSRHLRRSRHCGANNNVTDLRQKNHAKVSVSNTHKGKIDKIMNEMKLMGSCNGTTHKHPAQNNT